MIRLITDPFPVLETERLILCRMSVAHAERVYRLRTEEDVMQYIERPRPKSMEEIYAFIKLNDEIIHKAEGLTWAIVLKEENELVGNIGFWRVKKEHFRGEIGYAMLPEYWGKGIMSEAMKTILEYGFNVIGFHSIEADINSLNTASAKILERHGFRKEAHFHENFFWNGKFLDSIVYGLLRTEWEKSI